MSNAEYPEYDPVAKKRFRRVGDCIEYEPVIVTTKGTIPESQIKNLFTTQSVKPQQTKSVEPCHYGDCPFKRGCVTQCHESCAWFDKGCILSRSEDAGAALQVSDGKCPISGRKCNKACVMRHDNSCAIVDGFKERRSK